MQDRAIGAAIVTAFTHKIACEAFIKHAYESMLNGDVPYNPSKLASVAERCDEAQAELWRALMLELKEYDASNTYRPENAPKN